MSSGNLGQPLATVFVVDDDVSFLTAVTRLLRAGGYEVKTFTSAARFLQSPPPGDSPGCLIVDLQMPGLSGLELQEALAKAATRCHSSSLPATATFRARCMRCGKAPRIS